MFDQNKSQQSENLKDIKKNFIEHELRDLIAIEAMKSLLPIIVQRPSFMSIKDMQTMPQLCYQIAGWMIKEKQKAQK